MRVVTRFTFTEDDLRGMRASIGRGGKATRTEAQVFVDRAVRKAIEDAPDAKPKRRRTVKRETFVRAQCDCTETQKCAACRTAQDRIAQSFGHGRIAS